MKDSERANEGSEPLRLQRERELAGQIKTEISGQIFGGPLPHPDVVRAYGAIAPDWPERIMKMAESEHAHRHALETSAMAAQIDQAKTQREETRLGQIFGFVIGLAAITGGVFASVMGAQWSGAFIGGGGVIGLVTAFIKGRQYAQQAAKKEPQK